MYICVCVDTFNMKGGKIFETILQSTTMRINTSHLLAPLISTNSLFTIYLIISYAYPSGLQPFTCLGFIKMNGCTFPLKSLNPLIIHGDPAGEKAELQSRNTWYVF